MSTGEEIGLLNLAAFFLAVIWVLLHPPPRSRR
jgi:cbb3-type cytochrome oxidase subunit 3